MRSKSNFVSEPYKGSSRDLEAPQQQPGQYRRLRRPLLFLAFFGLSLNLRAPVTALPPIITEIQGALGIGAGVAGMLTSIPVFCFGFLSPLLGWLMKRLSLETSVLVTLLGILLGSVVRSVGGIHGLFAGTAILGIAITVGNIAGLMVIGRDFKDHANAMAGFYVCGMSIGALGTTALTAPLSQRLGWQLSLASISGILALGAVALWGVVLYGQAREKRPLHRTGQASPPAKPDSAAAVMPPASPPRSILRDPIIWILSVAFAAHTFLFYGLTAWLPAYLMETIRISSSRAGVVAALFQILGNLGCFGLPLLTATRRFSQRTLFLVVTLSWFAAAVGFWRLPGWWPAWVIFGGIGGGGGFTVIFGLVMAHAKTLDENRVLATVIQSAGYMVASLSPFVIGYFYTATGGWQAAFMILAAAAVVMTLCGIGASRGKAPQDI